MFVKKIVIACKCFLTELRSICNHIHPFFKFRTRMVSFHGDDLGRKQLEGFERGIINKSK
jgi:hypothetical protein